MPSRQARAAVGDRCHVWREQVRALQRAVDWLGVRGVVHGATPIVRAFEASKLRFRRNGRCGAGANRWEIVDT
jgi:hypothetical protein